MYVGKEYEKIKALAKKYNLVLPDAPGDNTVKGLIKELDALKDHLLVQTVVTEGDEVKMNLDPLRDVIALTFDLSMLLTKRCEDPGSVI